VLGEHCTQARYVWNLALEQWNYWRPGRANSPGNAERMRQLTDARAAFGWLAAGSVSVQQQALRDFDQARKNFFAGTHRRPTWRKAGLHEGFRQVAVRPGHVERLNRRCGRVWVPKVGPVRFRMSKPVPKDVKSYRVTRDGAGRWHVAFAVKPGQIEGPGDGSIVGVDRGVALTLACSDGTTYTAPKATDGHRAARRLSRAKRGSKRRKQAKHRLAVAKVRDGDRRKDFVEKASTDLARRFDVVRVEDLEVKHMVRKGPRKRGLNRAIAEQGWSMFAQRLGDKIGHRLERVPAAYTSQRCSCCGHVDGASRESQARFRCTSCGYNDNADVNAAKNIAAGHAVTARGGMVPSGLPVNREPQLRLVS
jgi:putative transposase